MSYLMPTYSASEPALTQRPASTALLVIDSEDRFPDYTASRAIPRTVPVGLNTPYNFTITRNQSILNGFLTRLAVTEINFPWAVPNINLKTRSILYSYQPNGAPDVSGTITLATGFYTPSQLAASFQAAVIAQAGAAAFTMAYGDDNTSNGSEPSFSYNAGGPGETPNTIAFFPMPNNTAAYPYPSQTKQLFDLLGFNTTFNSELAPFAITNRYTFCQAIRYVDIVCPQLTYNQALKDTMSQNVARDSLCRIYLGDANIPGNVDLASTAFCPPGCQPFTIYRNFATPKQIQWLGNQPVPGKLEFQVYDDTGALLTESIGLDGLVMDWSMTLLVTEN